MILTNEDLDSLESAAKAATPGPWETKEGPDFSEILANSKNIALVGSQHKDAAYIAAANPAVVLKLVAELRVKNNLDEINEWTEELEKNALRNELKLARAERDWFAEHIPNTVCPEGKTECDDRTPTAGGTVGYACLLCWLNAAREAVEVKK